MAQTEYFHSVRLLRDKCQGCVSCVKACPTEAIRVRNGKAEILPDRCIDCGACAATCPYHAFTIKTAALDGLEDYAYNIVLPAPSMYSQFPEHISLKDIWQGLYQPYLIEAPLTEQELYTLPFIQETKAHIIAISPVYKHVLSHQVIEARFVKIEIAQENSTLKQMQKISDTELDLYPVSRLIEKYRIKAYSLNK